MKIGLEVHVQLPTRSKMFCSCPTTGAERANDHVCPVCLGMPGSKPSLNKRALELGLTIAKMLNCHIPETTWFSRKTYFYPDLCKHYQITQYDTPVGEKGSYELNGRTIRITRVHLEEDPGSIKRVGEGSSLVDYNRSGIPLVEIVTEPDLTSPEEARDFLTQMLKDIRYAIDLPDDGERSVRCDCNISVGTERCEVKNVTGLKNAERCLAFEAMRQTKLIKAGGKIERETRHWDEARKVTYSARKKEYEADYGYIGEPDLGIYHIAKMAEGIKVKETPLAAAARLQKEYGIDAETAHQLVSTSMDLAALFERIAVATDAQIAKTWITGPISANWKVYVPDDENNGKLIAVIKDFTAKKITDTECTIRIKSVMTGKSAEAAATDTADLDSLIDRAIDDNPEVLADYRKNPKAANRIIGTVMKATGGKYSSGDIVAAAKRLIEARL
jgi:aspartyl-tRNA(Asn)/glutamyl-tRNA(Gln) amidotransferase subunit B